MARLSDKIQQGFAAWALRGPAPEAVPVILTQRRVYVLPTRAGLAYAFSLAIMLIGAINYNLSLGYALVFLLAGLGVSAIFHTFRNLAHIQLAPGRAEPVFAGPTTTARFGLVLANMRNEARLALRLKLRLEPLQSAQSTTQVDIPALASMQTGLDLPAPRRGWLALPRVTLETTYPLGLIRAWAYAAPDHRCLVYPEPMALAPPLPATPDGDSESNAAAQQAIGMDDFSGLRDYRPTDPLRHVAWKTAARQDTGNAETLQLQTKVFTGAASRTVWLDWNSLPASFDIEARLSCLTRWICDAHAEGSSWGLRLPGKAFAPASGNPHFHACLKALALYGKS